MGRRMLGLEHLLGHLARQPGGVHGVHVGIEHDPVHVPDQDGQEGQPGFVVVDDQEDLHHALADVGGQGLFEPHGQTGQDHDHRPPDQGPVLGLLHEGEAPHLGVLVGAAQVVHEHAPDLLGVQPVGSDVPQEDPALGGHQVAQVPEGAEDHDHGRARGGSGRGCRRRPRGRRSAWPTRRRRSAGRSR